MTRQLGPGPWTLGCSVEQSARKMRPFLLDDWPPCGDSRRPSKPPRHAARPPGVALGSGRHGDLECFSAQTPSSPRFVEACGFNEAEVPCTLRNHANSKAPIIPISWPCPETTTRATNHTLCNKSSQFGLLGKGDMKACIEGRTPKPQATFEGSCRAKVCFQQCCQEALAADLE